MTQPTLEQIEAGKKAIDDYFHGTKDADFDGSVAACWVAMNNVAVNTQAEAAEPTDETPKIPPLAVVANARFKGVKPPQEPGEWRRFGKVGVVMQDGSTFDCQSDKTANVVVQRQKAALTAAAQAATERERKRCQSIADKYVEASAENELTGKRECGRDHNETLWYGRHQFAVAIAREIKEGSEP